MGMAGAKMAVGGASSGLIGGLMDAAPHNIMINAITGIQQAKYNEQIAKNNAIIARQKQLSFEQKERQIEESGSFAVRQQRLQQEALIAQGISKGAAAGVQLGSGSILDWEVSAEEVFDEDRRQLDYDISNRIYEARIGAWNAKIEQNNFLSQASNSRNDQQNILTGALVKNFTGIGILGALGESGGLSGLMSGGSTSSPSSSNSMSGDSFISESSYDSLGSGSIGKDALGGSGSFFNTDDLQITY